ncbi:Hypothetical Protein NG00_00639 [Corynebacterium camporealensis]|nr:hypothetical protein [Corynebacterium camporealensis]AVH87966.1 Hypothetical Protein NG00_00639 [Corynebacterium camporealensis]
MDISRAIVTLWYVTTDSPADVLAAEPKADRGFGRKYLAQLNPNFPVTPIGQFPLNRSVEADIAEFYIGGYPGVTVVQTVVVEEGVMLSQLSPLLLEAIPARELYAFALNEEEATPVSRTGRTVNSNARCAAPALDCWKTSAFPKASKALTGPVSSTQISAEFLFPLNHRDLMDEAQRRWLGISIDAEGPDLDVVGYAVDGRPEPKVDELPNSTRSVGELATTSAGKLGLHDYDDYEDHSAGDTSTGEEIVRTTKKLGRLVGSWISQTSQSLKERWRS